MQFAFTEEQLAVQKTARDFATAEVLPKAAEIDREHRHPRELVARMAELGFMGIAIPEEYGGASLDTVSYALVLEEVSRACASTGVIMSVNNSLVCDPINKFGTDDQKRRWLTPLAQGKLLGCFALSEPEAGSDTHGMACEARRDGDGYVLNGTKTLISNGGLADFYVVFAKVDRANAKSVTAFVVDAHAAGFEFVRPLVMAAPHPLGEIAFRECRLEESARIGKEGEGLRLALTTLDRLRATVGAAACGMAARALHEAVEHARTRRQFGKPLADQPLIQEKIARMAIRLRASRLLVYEAAWEKDQGAERVTLESGMAKAFATENAQLVVDDAIQILGGRGVLKESRVDLLYRSVRALRIYEGTTEIQHLLVAGQILKPAQS